MDIVFTSHAEERIVKRRISKEEIVLAVKHPDKTIKRQGKYYFQKELERGIIEACCERKESVIKVITAYWI